MKLSVTLVVLSFIAIGIQAHDLPARYAEQRRGNQLVAGPCKQDSDCQQGCCAFNTGKCASPDIAQMQDGGCGFGTTDPGKALTARTQTVAELAARQQSKKPLLQTCTNDSVRQQGCCGFKTGKCDGAIIAQSNASGGCGRGSHKPNCNVATLLGFSHCVAGAQNGNLQDPVIQAAAAFVAQQDGFSFTPSV
ncbi:hypothetical protein MSAN_02020500 [Mycena sanguinolenta]|uniref:Uncharacterized protein n=1 Tax=Mycena sanguinolenta TaxID=230812 RepID=A0A8H6XLH0_9AGAR|nr:hypothetical protein MSAN_02020500 [Mycena sanguinolenta]